MHETFTQQNGNDHSVEMIVQANWKEKKLETPTKNSLYQM